MNLQPTTPATAPVEDMVAPQNQIPSSHAKYGGRFEKKKGLRLPEGCLSHSPFCRDEKLLGFIFGLQLSENHLFQWTFRVGNHRILKNRQSWEKNQLEKNQDVRPVIGFCFVKRHIKPPVFCYDMSRCHIFEATTWFAGVDPVGLFMPKKKSVLAACFAGYEPNLALNCDG